MKVSDYLAALASLPVRELAEIAPGTSLVIAPHPDDESLGCGGFIAEATRLGHPPVVVIVSDGAASHPRSRLWPPTRLAALREEETRKATAMLGLPPDRLHFLRLPDTAVPTSGPVFDTAVQALATMVRQYGCANVIAPWRHDPHCDHVAAWHMGLALKSLPPCPALLAYPVWGLTLQPDMVIHEAMPEGARLDISAHLATKRAAINAHRSQRGLVVADDPDGFTLPDVLLDRLLRPHEYLIVS